MKRFRTLSQLVCEDEWWQADARTMTVQDTDRGPKDTGLVDANGVTIYSVPETVPFGFQPAPRN